MASQKPDNTLMCSTRVSLCQNRAPYTPQIVSPLLEGTTEIRRVVISKGTRAVPLPAGKLPKGALPATTATRMQKYKGYEGFEGYEDHEEASVYEGFEDEEVVYEEEEAYETYDQPELAEDVVY